ncbi:MAG: complex I subunit 5 family protein [Lachnospiraceae bacterium]
MNYLLLLPVLFPILTGALIPLFKFERRRARELYVMACALLNSLMIFGLLVGADSVGPMTLFRISETLPVCFALDGLGKVFAGLLAFLWPLACCYAFEYMKHEGGENTFFAFYIMTYGVTVGIAFSANLITMYFFYELLTLVTLPIVMHGMKRKSILAGRKYVLYSMGGAAFAFMGMILLYIFSGTMDFTFGGVLGEFLSENQVYILRIVYVIMVFGFGVKAAIFPFHGWLPTASVAPTPVTALLHAVAVVNAGAFAILRITYYSFGAGFLQNTWAQRVIMAVALFTILYGSSMALKEQHFKRRLAYSTVSNLSYMIFGASMMSTAGMVGALSHMVFHGIIKITLFYVAGAVLYKTGKNYVDDLFGFGRRMPVIFGCFTLASAALTGVPMTAGFISKWNLLTAAAENPEPLAWVGIAVLLISAVLTAVYLFSIVIKAYFPGPGFNEATIAQVEDPNAYMKVPMVILCVVIVLLGMFSTPLVSYLEQVASGLL